jgi:hypothetical protein
LVAPLTRKITDSRNDLFERLEESQRQDSDSRNSELLGNRFFANRSHSSVIFPESKLIDKNLDIFIILGVLFFILIKKLVIIF